MDTGLKRSLVSVEQLNTLLEFMKEHPDLAKGLSRGRRGKLMTLKVWNACAKKLNAYKQGATKDGKGWSKYWCDWKYRVRRHALELKAAKDNNRSGVDSPAPLSTIEEMIISIIGEDSLESVVIKADPLGDDSNDDAQISNEQSNDIETTECSASRPKRRKRQHSIKDNLWDFNDPDSPPDTKARIIENEGESDNDDQAAQFLKLEKLKLENSKKIQESTELIATELSKLNDIMSQIRDVLINRYNV